MGFASRAKLVLVALGHPLKNILTQPLVSGPFPYPLLLVAVNQLSNVVLGVCAWSCGGLPLTGKPSPRDYMRVYGPIAFLRFSFNACRTISLMYLTLPMFVIVSCVKTPLTYVVSTLLGMDHCSIRMSLVMLGIWLATLSAVLCGHHDFEKATVAQIPGISFSLAAAVSDVALNLLIQKAAKDVPSLTLLARTTPLYTCFAIAGVGIFEASQLRQDAALPFPPSASWAYWLMAGTCILSPLLGYVDCETVGNFGAVGYALVARFHGVLMFAVGIFIFRQPFTWAQVVSYIVPTSPLGIFF